MNGGILNSIADGLRPALAAEKLRLPLIRLAGLCGELPPVRRDFIGALRRADGKIAVIGELKRASPSKGIIRLELDVPVLAKNLEAAGAAALSVLTEPNRFLGSRDNLLAASDAVSIPVLRKDFIFDPYQIYQSRLFGADAVLLIAAMLSDGDLRFLRELAESLGMAALVEAHSELEAERALASGAKVVGVNARDLRDFSTDPDDALAIIAKLPATVVRVAESAIRDASGLRAARSAGADAALIGETLMRAADPGAVLKALYENR